MEKSKTVCFTGHRPEKLNFSENDSKYNILLQTINRVISRLYQLGYTRFISGMARGFDTWAAETVCNLKSKNQDVKLFCAIPFPNQATSWRAIDRQRWEAIKNCSDGEKIVSTSYNKGCFHARNRYMVDNSDVVVCFYDGSKGGTAYTVDYALKNNKIVVRIHPDTFEVTIISDRTFD
jgi:uncharacterized phage-like protein YoqJ